jgi:hypothetical protein
MSHWILIAPIYLFSFIISKPYKTNKSLKVVIYNIGIYARMRDRRTVTVVHGKLDQDKTIGTAVLLGSDQTMDIVTL